MLNNFISKMLIEKPLEIEKTTDNTDTINPLNVILFNDDEHSFDEVILQIIKAIKCSESKATKIAVEAHVKGRAIVYSGEINKCLEVSSILQEIGLHTQIET